MTDNQWTPEPWKLGEVEGTLLSGNDVVARNMSLADAERTVACVNVFEGVPDDLLTVGMIADVLDAARRSFSRLRESKSSDKPSYVRPEVIWVRHNEEVAP